MFPKFGIHAIKCPNGRYSLVGSDLPARACYERKDGQPLTEADIEAITHAGPGFASVRAITYTTEAEALAAAKRGRS